MKNIFSKQLEFFLCVATSIVYQVLNSQMKSLTTGLEVINYGDDVFCNRRDGVVVRVSAS